MTKYEQIELLQKIKDNLCGIFDGIADEFDEDSEMYQSIAEVEKDFDILSKSLTKTETDTNTNYFEYVLGEDWGEDSGPYTKKFTLENCEMMMYQVAKMICFSDCSDERVTKIVYRGREIEYSGWQPGMVMEFVDSNGEVAWGGCFEQWDH